MDKSEVRKNLSASGQTLFDDIVNSRVLGANKHIEMIGDMVLDIVSEEQDLDSLRHRVTSITDFFATTRGNQSRAIYNAIQIMLCGFGLDDKLELESIRNLLRNNVTNFAKKSAERIDLIASYAAGLCETMDTIMIFDYSSTLNTCIGRLKTQKTIYIPESRALDGGRPFLKASLDAGHNTHFIPDTTMMDALKGCDAAFIGAETIYPDGTVFNTIGSDILAVLCEKVGVPLYAVTPMIKLDMRPLYGYSRLSPMPYDYGQRLALSWDSELRNKIDFNGIKLLEVPPRYLRAIITENGIIPPSAFYVEAKQYYRELGGEI